MKKILFILTLLFLNIVTFSSGWDYGKIQIQNIKLISQDVKTKNNNKYIIGFSKLDNSIFLLLFDNNKNPLEDIVSPISIDNGEEFYLLTPHSLAMYKLDNQLLNLLKKGNRLKIIIYKNKSNPITVDLTGFTEALKKLK